MWLFRLLEKRKFRPIGIISGRVDWNDASGGVDWQFVLSENGFGKRRYEYSVAGESTHCMPEDRTSGFLKVKRWCAGMDVEGIKQTQNTYAPKPPKAPVLKLIPKSNKGSK